jgi:hypothetical protein
MICSRFSRGQTGLFPYLIFCHAKHVKVPSKITRLRNKLFHAWNDYREDDDKKS